MENYSEWLQGTEKWALDKDIKVLGNRVYSKDTCIFTTHQKNSDECNKRVKVTGLTYIGVRVSDGRVEEFTNQSEFERKYNLTGLSKVLSGKQKACKDWIFSIKEK